MEACVVLMTLGVLGVDFGWQPTKDGELEYIIQIEPQLIEALRRGEDVVSAILPEVKGIRRFRIRIGNGPLPRQMPKKWKAAPPVPVKTAKVLAPSSRLKIRRATFVREPAGQFKEAEVPANRVAALPPRAKRRHPRANPLINIFAKQTLPRRRGRPSDEESIDHAVLKPTLEPAPDELTEPDSSPTSDRRTTWVVIGLFASIGLNGFLGWMWASFYRKYRDLLAAR